NVSYMEIGFGDGTNLGMSSSKWNILYIDNIALYPPKCVPSQSSLQADITEDCVVNYDDLDVFSDNWLLAGYTVSATAVSDDDLVLYYDFNGDAVDSVAGNDGTVQNLGSAATYEAGHDNQCIHFDATSGTSGSNMIIPEAALASLDDEVTFSFWLKKDEYSPQWYQALFAGHGVATGQCEIFKGYAPAEATNMQTTFSVGSDGCVAWQSWDSIPGLFDDDDPTIYTDWNHYAVVKNVKLGYIYLYINGELEQFISGKYKPVTGCDKFRLGSSASIENIDDYNFCKASFDEFKMYKRALTHAEILTLAGQSSATVPLSMFDGADDSDFNTDEAVDFKDYAILANEWLVEDLWP
ncbi:MAG: LamG domain-containing protein, partial [Planctomycetes bacterium]|nr:LamG domain-containing protein [Planctomycetota bacterium]